ncbi:purine-binding chemotaxis protein CheW [Hoeflea marina]|uniref:Purine-binding chemotaxis protein CheW n=1 Tax=Hoeflea marina TaxID=274592 RepID=A0A317PFR3_9HYPH|nr:chemotaxis protein CheW [Hoeflea marina]PWV97511.1 purine-binding chemotaxis protein CheW [Hoeflea marina]
MNTKMQAARTVGDSLEIIAFRLNSREFCVRTIAIREIRGWAPSTPIPHSPPEVVGVMNLRGSVIPIIDLARKLGIPSTEANERSAIVVADVHNMAIGLVVDGVSDILTVTTSQIQPVPKISSIDQDFCEGIVTQPDGMICFLNLNAMFRQAEIETLAA